MGTIRGKRTVESCCCIDINLAKRRGWLDRHHQTTERWVRHGDVITMADLLFEGDRILIECRYGGTAGVQPFAIVRKPAGFGGTRAWFRCHCGREVAQLYSPLGGRFACRHCHCLTYASRSTSGYERARRRRDEIKTRLDGKPGALEPFPDKPRGMHWKTYQRLRRRYDEADQKSFLGFAELASRLRRRIRGKAA